MKSRAILELGETLLENQVIINQLQQENHKIKQLIVDHIAIGQELDFGNGKIECRKHQNSRSFVSRKEVLNYIRLKYGKEVSRDVDSRCTKVTEAKKTLYIKPKNSN
ncbi:hypothetical protein IVG45_19125 [Methylomonas sp. LL1]|uniref:hypothetical protein n=1 Tax=Methylomonas sp. LL1 TaxID=2785785 RepID=UPI0018C4421D|nr:hypothetical protein [Methylomonas sp. LL1]QPK62915.1 hypothetical protein IVG45_19125 [Methylomonas sp. LL1]